MHRRWKIHNDKLPFALNSPPVMYRERVSAVLLIAYLNSEGLSARIRELNSLKFSEIYVFLDGFNPEAHPDLKSRRDELELFLDNCVTAGSILALRKADKNLGVGIAVPLAIDWFFSNVEFGLILEDDCKLLGSSQANLRLCFEIQNQLPNSVVCLSSPQEAESTIDKMNEFFFILTSFFSSWGWITSREVWMKNRVRKLQLTEVWSAVWKLQRVSNFQRFLLAISWTDIWISLRKNQDRLWAFRYTILLINNGVGIIYPSQKCVQHEPNEFGTNVKRQPKWDQFEESSVLSTQDLRTSVEFNSHFEKYIIQNVHGATVISLFTRKIFWALQKLGLK